MDKKIYNMANDIVTDFTELESRKLSEKESGNISAASEKDGRAEEAYRGRGKWRSVRRPLS